MTHPCAIEGCACLPTRLFDSVEMAASSFSGKWLCEAHTEAQGANVVHAGAKKQKRKLCAQPGCKKRPSFGAPDTKIALFCAAHKKVNMIDVRNKHCAQQGCIKQSAFNVAGAPCALFCAEHKLADMVNVINKRCAQPGCTKRPVYNAAGARTALFCVEHKKTDMIDVRNKHCAQQGCIKRPAFNVAGAPRALFCAEHKLADMVDVIHTRCAQPGCTKRPVYNVAGALCALFCVEHKKTDMIDVRNKRCAQPGCFKIPTYNVVGAPRALFCVAHKLVDMIDVINKRCAQPGCTKRPTYNVAGAPRALFCAAHKLADMVDVISKYCTHPGCETHARFGPIYQRATHCARHRQQNEFSNRKPRCEAPGCKERPTHTTIEDMNYPNYCAEHAPTEAREVSDAMCKKCKKEALISSRTRLCAICEFVSVHKTYHKYREEQTMAALKAIGLEANSFDRIIPGSSECGVRKRPDAYFDRGTYSLILEVDECQHARGFMHSKIAEQVSGDEAQSEAKTSAQGKTAGYSCDCEMTRMVLLHQVCGQATVFVRFNPDSYKGARGQRVPANTSRYPFIAQYVKSLIRDLDAKPPRDGLYVIYLYYDGYDGRAQRYLVDYIGQAVIPMEEDESEAHEEKRGSEASEDIIEGEESGESEEEDDE